MKMSAAVVILLPSRQKWPICGTNFRKTQTPRFPLAFGKECTRKKQARSQMSTAVAILLRSHQKWPIYGIETNHETLNAKRHTQICAEIPNFWLNALLNHPDLQVPDPKTQTRAPNHSPPNTKVQH